MTAPARAEQIEPKPPPWDVRCTACGAWIATVSGDTTWARVRCISRRCPKYSMPQERKRPTI